MPATLTERVRQQAKTRVSRVRVVRKAAANTSSMHSASLDFDSSSHQLNEPSQAALKPKGSTSAFQLSWPPPAAGASAGVAQTNKFPLHFTGVLCLPPLVAMQQLASAEQRQSLAAIIITIVSSIRAQA